MASIKFGSIITEAAGKIGGQILQRGRTGAQMRNLTNPIRVRSNIASTVQVNFSTASSGWRRLTNSHRAGWNSLASTLTRLNRFGDTYTPTGFQVFCEANLNISLIDPDAKIQAAPTQVALPDVTSFYISAATNPANYVLNWTYISGSDNWHVLPYLYGTSPFGQTFSGVTPRYMDMFAAVSNETIDFTGAVASAYPLVKAAQMTLVIGFRLVNIITGQATPMVKLSGIYS